MNYVVVSRTENAWVGERWIGNLWRFAYIIYSSMCFLMRDIIRNRIKTYILYVCIYMHYYYFHIIESTVRISSSHSINSMSSVRSYASFHAGPLLPTHLASSSWLMRTSRHHPLVAACCGCCHRCQTQRRRRHRRSDQTLSCLAERQQLKCLCV